MSFEQLRQQQMAAGAVLGQSDGLELPVQYGDSAAEYDAALTGAAVLDTSAHGRIWMSDKDRASLLHRLSTNAIEQLQPGQGTRTVLTNHNGRIIDLLTVHALPEQLLLVTSPQQRSAVFQLLKGNIFFRDKVKLAAAHDSTGQFALYGPASADLLSRLIDAPVADLALHAVVAARIAAVAVWVARALPLAGEGFTLYVPVEGLAAVWTALLQAGVRPLGQNAYNILRVEAGYAAYGHELSLEYIPLETGLWDAVSFSKGCYVGQEIIARMESRNRMARQLRGLRLTGMVDTPRKLHVGGKEAGTLTSAVHSPRFGSIGLAYVRTAYLESGDSIGLADTDITGELVQLPFAE